MQNIRKVVYPADNVVYRNSTTILSSKEKRRANIQENSFKKLNIEPIATFKDLNFDTQGEFKEFKDFLTKYLAFSSDIMELLLALASLKCFPVEPARVQRGANV